jgi:hypothetical protein
MMAIQAFIQRHAVLTYFVLTFAISGGGVLIALGPGGLPIAAESFEAVPYLRSWRNSPAPC